jgi:hypothetical protein
MRTILLSLDWILENKDIGLATLLLDFITGELVVLHLKWKEFI